ncbi:E3 ubiquitin-protein ligase fancl [Thalictrum thalictroides]|uniref:E3 ubiquitin-protein ligase fancl n=1 Tax=Thalictrum thalictroides TaxID=46969 RepID=A0A7J6WDZ5_THATH|nr:E3 ubiquitin-protein ligase fancl [Thalictrum thalictroides]
MENFEKNRSRKLSPSPSFYQLVYSEIEEVGWEHLVKLADELTYLSFRILDTKKQSHILEIHLPRNYPRHAPSIAADVPYICELKWSASSRLNDIVYQFREHLVKLQEFWSILDNIDSILEVIDPRQPSHAASFRRINLGNDCSIVLSVNAHSPRSLPECRFLGPSSLVNSLRKTWKRNNTRWMEDTPYAENLANVLEISLPKPSCIQNQHRQVECGICYVQYLPIDVELGAKSGSRPDCTCDNSSCSRAFHSVCLGDWLRSITTTRQSFDVLFGNCPYCSGPVAVKLNSNE